MCAICVLCGIWHTHTTHMRPAKASMCACIQGDATGMPSCKSIQRIMNHTFYTIVLKKRDSCTCTQRVVPHVWFVSFSVLRVVPSFRVCVLDVASFVPCYVAQAASAVHILCLCLRRSRTLWMNLRFLKAPFRDASKDIPISHTTL